MYEICITYILYGLVADRQCDASWCLKPSHNQHHNYELYKALFYCVTFFIEPCFTSFDYFFCKMFSY